MYELFLSFLSADLSSALVILVSGKSPSSTILHAFTHPFHSVQRGGRVEIIANDQGHRITPSWVGFAEDERLYVLVRHPLLARVKISLVLETLPRMLSIPTPKILSLMPNVSLVVRWMTMNSSGILNTSLSMWSTRVGSLLSKSTTRARLVIS